MDLLTVLAHELAHLLGHEDLDPVTHAHDLMAATLGTGIRRLPEADSDVLAAVQPDPLAPTSASQAEAAVTDKCARDDLFARVDGWLESDLDDLLGGEFDDDSDEPDDDTKLWWALYGQE
jgi:hypothetical protein